MDIAMTRLCTICARAGSKGVKNKNIRDILGKPLIAYSILQARESRLFGSVAVSSDSKEILEIANVHGADFLIERPAELATDEAPKLPVIQHCVLETERIAGKIFSVIVDLDATSPLRLADDIRGAVKLLEDRSVSNVITGTPAHRSPYFNLVELGENGVAALSKTLPKPVARRQDAPKCFDMNASIYVWMRDALFENTVLFKRDTLLYIMPQERSVDIDSEIDFQIVELLMQQKGSNQ
jgi:CMP-N,N'-diacetyllegionaminic acid synthase